MNDALLPIDLFQSFDHADGEQLLASLRRRLAGIEAALQKARGGAVPVIYVNDWGDRWDSDARALVADAVAGPGGDVLAPIRPQAGDAFVLKPRYSIFDHTPLALLLRELKIERLLLAGVATEMCVTQSAIDAKELGYKVTILRDACAAVDAEMEQISLAYAERVVGAFVHVVDQWRPGLEHGGEQADPLK